MSKKQEPPKPLLDWNGQPIAVPGPLGPPSVNPCVTQFGIGPQGKRCKECVHLHRHQQEAVWFKCEFRAWKAKASGTVYPGKDHRANWPACAKFEAEERES